MSAHRAWEGAKCASVTQSVLEQTEVSSLDAADYHSDCPRLKKDGSQHGFLLREEFEE
jgi:hypothetical protein